MTSDSDGFELFLSCLEGEQQIEQKRRKNNDRSHD